MCTKTHNELSAPPALGDLHGLGQSVYCTYSIRPARFFCCWFMCFLKLLKDRGINKGCFEGTGRGKGGGL